MRWTLSLMLFSIHESRPKVFVFIPYHQLLNFRGFWTSVLWLISAPGRGRRILDRRQLTCEKLCGSSIPLKKIGSCHLSLYHVRVTITMRKSSIESWEKTNLYIQWQLGKILEAVKKNKNKNKMCRIMLCSVTAPLSTARLEWIFTIVLQPRTHYRNTWVNFSISRVSVVLQHATEASCPFQLGLCFPSDFQCKFLGK